MKRVKKKCKQEPHFPIFILKIVKELVLEVIIKIVILERDTSKTRFYKIVF